MGVRTLLAALHDALFVRRLERIAIDRLIERTDNFGNRTWLGKPIWQNTLDLWTIQETIWEVNPSLIIECGSHRGGAAFFYAQLLDLMATTGRVVSIDVAKLHDLSHPRITYLIGNSLSEEISGRVRRMAEEAAGPIMVILDSDHSEEHVAEELETYAPMTTVGSYCLVQDGIIDELYRFRSSRPGPLRALEKYVARHPEFRIDHERCERFIVTHHPKGWLERTR